MPILPIIDTLILLSWTTLTVGGVLKVCNTTFGVHWQLVGMAPSDMLVIGLTMLVFSIALIGRTWVKSNDPGVLAERRANSTLEAYAKMKRDSADERVGAEPSGATAPFRAS